MQGFCVAPLHRCAVCCTKSVPVYKLIAVGTIEEMLYMRDATGCVSWTVVQFGVQCVYRYDCFKLNVSTRYCMHRVPHGKSAVVQLMDTCMYACPCCWNFAVRNPYSNTCPCKLLFEF